MELPPPDKLDELDLQEQLQLLREIDRLQRAEEKLRQDYGLAFYKPHRKQELFHRAGDYKFRYARTGNRFGKSQMGAAEDVSFAIGERPWFDSGDSDRTKGIPNHPTKGLIITTDWDKSREIFTEHEGGEVGKLFQYLPAGSVKKVWKNSARAIERMVIGRPRELGGGESIIQIDTTASYKQNALSQESSLWDWIHVDEPIPEGQWKGASRGLMDRKGKAWFTCTPLDQPWMNRKFMPNNSTQFDESRPYVQDIRFEDVVIKTWMMVGSTDDNPYISKEGIATFMHDLARSPEEEACRRHGKPMALSGLVFPEFLMSPSPEGHVYWDCPKGWDAVNRPPKDYTIRLAIDPHNRIPMAVLFCAVSPTGRIYFYDELFVPWLIPELCEEIVARTKGYYIQDSLIDPFAKTRDPLDDSCMMDEFIKFGVWCTEASKAKGEGILRARDFLRSRTNGTPTMQIGAHLKRFLFEIDNWVYDPDTFKPLDKDDHIMEDFYRLCLTDLTFVSPDGVAVPRYRETNPDLLVETLLRNELQQDSDFQEQDLDEDADVVVTRQRTAQEARWRSHRLAAKRKHHDAY